MATDALDIRMARLEGACEQINERLHAIDRRLTTEIAGVRSEISALRDEFTAELRSQIGSVRGETAEMRRQMTTQFYWLLTLVLGSALLPLVRDLAR
jgi:hypothetical protein